MPKYIDIHAHVNFKAFDEDRDVVIRRALDNDTMIINIGTQYDTSKKAVEMTNDYEGVYATIGLHPIHTGASYHDQDELGSEGKEFTSRGEIFNKDKYRELVKLGKVVGIGECGLDYYRLDEDSIEKQKIWLPRPAKTTLLPNDAGEASKHTPRYFEQTSFPLFPSIKYTFPIASAEKMYIFPLVSYTSNGDDQENCFKGNVNSITPVFLFNAINSPLYFCG